MISFSILLIEDNPNDVLLVKEALRHRESRVHIETASTLAKGMELLEAHHYDVVLLDLLLPDSKVSTILSPLITILSNHPGQYPTVVVLTAIDDRHIKLEALHMGAQGYFCKKLLEPDSDLLWVCLEDAYMRGAYIHSLLRSGLPNGPMPLKSVTDAEKVIDSIIERGGDAR